jgi:hypothetical protein
MTNNPMGANRLQAGSLLFRRNIDPISAIGQSLTSPQSSAAASRRLPPQLNASGDGYPCAQFLRPIVIN